MTPVAYRTVYKNGEIRQTPVYADQFYKLPFWTNVKYKLKRLLRRTNPYYSQRIAMHVIRDLMRKAP